MVINAFVSFSSAFVVCAIVYQSTFRLSSLFSHPVNGEKKQKIFKSQIVGNICFHAKEAGRSVSNRPALLVTC